jgi:hypothetical protein
MSTSNGELVIRTRRSWLLQVKLFFAIPWEKLLQPSRRKMGFGETHNFGLRAQSQPQPKTERQSIEPAKRQEEPIESQQNGLSRTTFGLLGRPRRRAVLVQLVGPTVDMRCSDCWCRIAGRSGAGLYGGRAVPRAIYSSRTQRRRCFAAQGEFVLF